MSYIGATPAESYASFYVQHFTTSATTSYALDYPVVNENDLRLVINNVVQQPGSSYAYTAAASTLTLSAATTTSDTMYTVFLGRALQTVNPPADSVGGSQLADSAISGQTALGAEPADTDEFLVSDAGTLKRMDYSYIKGAGKIGQVVSAVKTDTFSMASTTFADITDVTVDITPTATSSKVLIVVQLTGGLTSGYNGNFRLVRDSTVINLGDAAGSRSQAMSHFHSNSSNHTYCNIGSFLDSPSTTSATTYKVQVNVESGGTVWSGASVYDSDTVQMGRTTQTITVMEVLA